MKSETRANLIFLSIFLVLMIPGVVIVTLKMIRGGQAARPLQTPAVRREVPYMNPILAVSSFEPMTPPSTGSFVSKIGDRMANMQRGLASSVSSSDFKPRMSENYQLQWIGEGEHEGKYHVALLGWNGKFVPLASLYAVTGTQPDGTAVTGSLDYYEAQNMPYDLREELKDFGWIKPTDGVMWMIVSFPQTAPVASVRVRFEIDGKVIEDRIDSPSAASTTRPAGAR